MRFLLRLSVCAGLASSFPVNTSAPPLCNFSTPTNPVIGTIYPLCVFMMSGPSSDPTSPQYVLPQIQSIAFGVSVDTYSMLNLAGSYAQFNLPQSDQDNLYAWMTGVNTSTAWPQECGLQEGVTPTFTSIENGTVQSCPQLVATVSNTIPVASVVAVMEKGRLVNLTWDNQCQTCPVTSDLCMAGNQALTIGEGAKETQYLTANPFSSIALDNKMCGVSQTQCNSTTNTSGINCDLRILLSWSGTDSKGKRLLSSNLRLTQFSGASVGSMWNSIANSFNPDTATSANTVDYEGIKLFMSTIEGKKNRLVAVQSLSLFIECAVNIYIRSRKLFPGFSFSNHMRIGQSFLLCDVKSVKQYIKQLCSSIQTLFLHDRVKCFTILASDSQKRPIERFVIEFPEDFAKSIFYSLPLGSTSRTDLETNSACTEIFREALTHLERKLGRSLPDSGEPIAYWEALVDVKRSSAQATECMDMPSGWMLDSDAKFFEKNLARHPIKSTCIQDSVVVLSYVDEFVRK